MNLLDVIPIGKEYRQTREQLMYKAKITDIRTFREELSKLKSKYIIISDNGYYLPSNKEEYNEFIKKQNKKSYEISKTINLAYKEMEELE